MNRPIVCFLFLFLPVENFPKFCDHISFINCHLVNVSYKKKIKDNKVVYTYIR